MKILIVSDSHDNWKNLETAISIGNEQCCEVMLHAGDFVSPSGIKILNIFRGHVHLVFGNNEGELVGLVKLISESNNITLHYKFGESVMNMDIDGLQFYMNHYPSNALAIANTDEYNVCVYGHDHVYHDETMKNGTRLLNPGEIVGWKTGTATCIIFDTETKIAEKIIVAKNQVHALNCTDEQNAPKQ